MKETEQLIKHWLKSKGWSEERSNYGLHSEKGLYKRYGYPLSINDAATYEMVKDILESQT